MRFLLALAITASCSLFLLAWRRFLRLVACLLIVIVLVVTTPFLIRPDAAGGKLVTPEPAGHCSGTRRTSLTRLSFENSELLFVRLLALQSF
jgi:hypothetical protein